MKTKHNIYRVRIARKRILGICFAAVLFGMVMPKSGQAQGEMQNVSQWTVETHDGTNFPLLGKHRIVECRECHLNLVFEGTPASCEACHWERRRDDRYELRLGAHCADCHTPYSWKNVPPNKWNHTGETGYRLQGIHLTLDCADCHGDRGFASTSVDCFGCHAEDFEETRDPDHTAAGFPTQCRLCHPGNNRWEGAAFSHDFFTLRGRHRLAACSDCHADGRFEGLPADCYSCHARDYDSTDDPDHRRLGFPLDCVICHGTRSETWDDAKFSHTFFVLRGEHKAALCSECHPGGQFEGLSQECVSCHRAEYRSVKDPDHERAGFPTDCAICHGTRYRTWEGAKFDHDSFVLRGQHKLTDCNDCHGDGVYKGLSSECVSCHLADYNSARDPDHRQLDFPTDCVSCHGNKAQTWEDADFSHDDFVLRGQHKLAACSDCHPDGSTNISALCISCHRDDYQKTTDPDHVSLNFPTACQTCHGIGAQTWEGATFNHNAIWPLQGAHVGLDCSRCHASGTDLPRNCYGCHSDDYLETTNPDHQAVGFPTTCELCHYPTHFLWTQAVFDHAFPINSGRHGNLDCTDCHLTANFKEFSCIHCHAHNQTNMNNQHRGVTGYVYTSQACYACHPQGRE